LPKFNQQSRVQQLQLHSRIFLAFFKIGAFVIGGGFAMIPVIQREIVTNKQWVSEEEFLDLIAVTQSAPGPVAVNTAVFIGYKLQGISGATVALLGSVLPSFLIILTLALFLSSLENNLILTRFLAGVRPAVAALILGVGLKMGFKALRSPFALLLSILAFGLLFFAQLHPFLLIVLGAPAGIAYWWFTGKQTDPTDSKEVS